MIEQTTLAFLKALKTNNNRPWFEKNKSRYHAAKDNFGSFVADTIAGLEKKDSSIQGLDPKHCTFRINRDVRFSTNKDPYKTNMGAFFSKDGKKTLLAGYYVQIEPGNSFAGGGLWQPETSVLKKMRQEVDYCLEEFEGIVGSKKFKSTYGSLSVESKLQREPKGYEKDNPAIEFLKLKNFVATTHFSDEVVCTASFQKKVLAALEALVPLVAFINRAIEQ